jgi:hypothetical protein
LKADGTSDEPALLRLTPLLRVEALYLLSQTGLGLVVCTVAGMRTRTPGFHAVLPGELVILTPITTALESTLRDDRPLTYQAESVDELTGTGWHATFSGPARIVAGPPLRRQHTTAVSHLQAGLGTRMLRLRPQDIKGHRFERLDGAS